MADETCPRCGSTEIDGVDEPGHPARCHDCRLVFDPSKRSEARPAVVAKDAPRGWRCQIDGREVLLERRWKVSRPRRPLVLGLLFAVSIALCAILLTGAEFGVPDPGRPPLNLHLMGILGVGVSAFLGYTFLASVMNTTIVEAGKRGLSVRNRPLPWLGEWKVERGDVQQVFGEELPQHGGMSAGLRRDQALYRVSVALRAQPRARVLVDDLESPREALFVERKVEWVINVN